MDRFAAEHLARRPRPDPARRRDERRRPPPPRPRAARSTTSAAATSTWPAGSPSCSTGSTRCLAALGAAGPVGEWMAALRDGVARPHRRARRRRLAGPAVRARAGPGRRRPPATAQRRAAAGRRARAARSPGSAGRPTRANFRTGTLTVCTMVPMRSVPHRVVCLVGLDDGVFPRAGVGRRRRRARPPPADRRARRAAARTASCCSTRCWPRPRHLVITYTGANEHSGARRPPAVPLGELLDAADRTTAAPVRDAVLTRHPLQPYDARNLEARPARPAVASGCGRRGRSASTRAALAGARGRGRRAPPAAAAPRRRPLPARPPDDVSLADLKAFLTHPVRAFLRGRLDVVDAVRARRARRRDPGRRSTPSSCGRSATGCCASVLAGQDADRGDDRRAAARHAAARPARASAPSRGVAEECQKLWTSTADAARRRPRGRSTSTSTSATAAG